MSHRCQASVFAERGHEGGKRTVSTCTRWLTSPKKQANERLGNVSIAKLDTAKKVFSRYIIPKRYFKRLMKNNLLKVAYQAAAIQYLIMVIF